MAAPGTKLRHSSIAEEPPIRAEPPCCDSLCTTASPCPAEAHELHGQMQQRGAFCEFYEEQVRYALRLIADEKVDDYLWDGWDQGMQQTFDSSAFC